MNLRIFGGGNTDKSLLEDKRKLELEMVQQVKACRRAERHNDELSKAYEAAESRFRQVSIEKKNIMEQCDDMIKARRRAERHSDELSKAYEAAESRFRQVSIEKKDMMEQYDDRITALTMEHSQILDVSNNKYNWAMESMEVLKQEHKKSLQQLKINHDKETSRLTGQLLVNQDDNLAWPDDKLRVRFRELHRLVGSVTSPRNQELIIPQNQKLGSHLDPTDFLSRIGRKKSHFLLQSVIWTILHEQFFSAPFGFGALGPGKGKNELLGVHLAWRKLFDEHRGTASFGGDECAVFYQDKLANKWRSTSFQCIGAAIGAKEISCSPPDSPLAKLSTDNVQQGVDRIMSVFSEVSKLSNSLMRSKLEDEIQKLVYQASQIALQFGSHSAQLHLSVPQRGTQIKIGEEFFDCEGGDYNKGTVCLVDLVIVPGLHKIGDGRSDMSSKRVITPCEIYPG